MSFLDVHVVGIRGVRGGGLVERADPYVRLILGSGILGRKVLRTKTMRNAGPNANFDQTLTFDLGRGPPATDLRVEVWDDDAVKDDLMSQTTINIREALDRGTMSGFFPLGRKRGARDNGQIELIIRFRRR